MERAPMFIDWKRVRHRGFTLLEIAIVVFIVGILAALVIPAYTRYKERAKVTQAVAEVSGFSVLMKQFELDNGRLPDSLIEVAGATKLDPWGNPYAYMNLQTMKGNGHARKDKKLSPINSDFDLYSMGKDGQSSGQLNNKVSRDDVVRARDGKFVGLAEDFDP